MMQPPGFVHPEFPNHVCKLEKALYGLKQSPCAWFTTKLSHALSQWGFTSSLADSSMFIYKSNSIFLVILIYVDDIITVTHSESISQLVLSLGHHFAIKDLRLLHYFLVIKVHRSTSGLHLSQHKYITDLLACTSMTDSKSVHSPMASGYALSIHDGTPLEDGTTYRSVVGALQYCTLTRPNISFVVNKVCQFMHSPSNVHWQVIKRTLHYLKGTSHYGLSIQATPDYNLTCFSYIPSHLFHCN
ncbi:Retrovirus-related Pol polyprotein from transposon RE1 [Vitis vinifera]|uniref:Retrovirus-related Pol polyprotein from transposon RE1 n=1 Tax=Vitis vinifera TaxID=29760 RepID=A0A438JPM9_VITVI|nr:Retrovirus-related Pol polyprotein from transposon RE1 [Vitis vinifera]